MEFCKDRIFTALNADELKQGDKVIVADTIMELRKFIEEKADDMTLFPKIKEILSDNHEKRFYLEDNMRYPLAYLVERKENCTNCGSHDVCGFVQNQSRFASLNRCEAWKPKTEKPYRPFRDTDELIKVWEKKWSDKTNGQKWHDCKLNMPLIWIRKKESVQKSDGHLITDFLVTGVEVKSYYYDLSELFTDFEFLDGSPCGVEE